MKWLPEDQVEIGRRVRGKREELGLRQRDLAEYLTERGFQTSERTLQRYEKGEYTPAPNEINDFGAILGVTFGDLLARRFGHLMEGNPLNDSRVADALLDRLGTLEQRVREVEEALARLGAD